ncbi:hypothetical protein MPL3356_150335 [Mesorhizobium plurifarium]|uniref:Uncharacterized protein n=1 Tax=Mesorhizobium plurifarium TaxID=69974 RepID=A0A090F577_MESPL|nr:hypothetical protein MPL3356_150335 [Mesorhizobium plurifarium]CDX17069.1 hypothetical protein MPLB_1670094 [Mesorhizobium sp. ORS 3324]
MIGHIKAEHRMDRNYLAGEQGDAVNAILAAAGYNSSLLPNWFGQHLWLLLAALRHSPDPTASQRQPDGARRTGRSAGRAASSSFAPGGDDLDCVLPRSPSVSLSTAEPHRNSS